MALTASAKAHRMNGASRVIQTIELTIIEAPLVGFHGRLGGRQL